MYKIGDIVTVVNSGYQFSTYDQMAELMELTNWENNRCIEDKVRCRIVAKSYHGKEHDVLLYGIENLNTRHQFIIGEAGISDKTLDIKIQYGDLFEWTDGDNKESNPVIYCYGDLLVSLSNLEHVWSLTEEEIEEKIDQEKLKRLPDDYTCIVHNNKSSFKDCTTKTTPIDDKKVEALRKSIKHWELIKTCIINTDWDKIFPLGEISEFVFGQIGEGIHSDDCALCDLYILSGSEKCLDCPLSASGNYCGDEGSPWKKVVQSTRWRELNCNIGYMISTLKNLYKKYSGTEYRGK